MTDRRQASTSRGRALKRALRPLVEGVEGRVLLSAAPPSPVNTQAPVNRSLDDRLAFAINTVQQGKAMSHSHDVRFVGSKYAGLTTASDTRKVGYAYLHAALRGDGRTIGNLGNTRLVQKVGHDFTQLSHSRRVKQLGDAFANFGKSVAAKFNDLFGPTDHSSKKK